MSPHLAVELAGHPPLSVTQLAAGVRAATPADAILVVEAVGGLLVPLGPDGDVRDLAVALGLPVVIVARPGLGTINHTLLTLEAARRVALSVAGVVLTPWPETPDAMLRSNRETIARLGDTEVATLGRVAGPRARGARRGRGDAAVGAVAVTPRSRLTCRQMRRGWALIGAVALVLTLTPVRAGAASAYQQVLRVYEQQGSVPSCQFTAAAHFPVGGPVR